MMERLADSKPLVGTSETITISELRKQPGEVFSQVEMGRSFTVTKNGKTIAEISEPEPDFDWRAFTSLRKGAIY